MRRARELSGADTPIGLVAWKEQNLLMVQGPVTDFGFTRPWDKQFIEAAQWQAQAPSQRVLFILDSAMDVAANCIDKSKGTRVGIANRREWWLLRGDAVTPGCTPTGREKPEGSDDNDP
jgi:hypothetical protein